MHERVSAIEGAQMLAATPTQDGWLDQIWAIEPGLRGFLVADDVKEILAADPAHPKVDLEFIFKWMKDQFTYTACVRFLMVLNGHDSEPGNFVATYPFRGRDARTGPLPHTVRVEVTFREYRPATKELKESMQCSDRFLVDTEDLKQMLRYVKGISKTDAEDTTSFNRLCRLLFAESEFSPFVETQ